MATKLEQFIENARSIHGTKYNYDKVVFRGVHSPVIIICPLHGEFSQRPVKHISQKCGCPKCGKSRQADSMRSSKQLFIQKAKNVHGDRYVYDYVNYVNNYTPITIVCPDHGPFDQRPVKHTSQKCGCPACKLTKNTDEFIPKANRIHMNRYSYELTHYVDHKTPINITCKNHGVFTQTPNAHLQGYGCPTCGKENSKGLYCESTLNGTSLGQYPGILYFVRIEADSNAFYKVGITKNSVEKRLYKHVVEIVCVVPGKLIDLYRLEQHILRLFEKQKHQPRSMAGDGATECLLLTSDQKHAIVDILMDFQKYPM